MKTYKFRSLLLVPALLVAAPAAALASDSSSTQASPPLEASLKSAETALEQRGSATPESLGGLKTKAGVEVAKRQSSLTKWAAQIAQSKADCGQNAAATARIATTQANLAGLNSQIQAATDLAAAKVLYRQIFTHQRVYLVVSPAVHVALACSHQSSRSVVLTNRLTELQGKVATATAAGANTSGASALLAQVPALIQAGKTTATTAAISVAGLAPDLGVEATKTTNATAVTSAKGLIKQSDSSLDSAGRLLNDAAKLLVSAKKDDAKADKKAANEAEKTAKESERAANKAKQQAEVEAKKGSKKNK